MLLEVRVAITPVEGIVVIGREDEGLRGVGNSGKSHEKRWLWFQGKENYGKMVRCG